MPAEARSRTSADSQRFVRRRQLESGHAFVAPLIIVNKKAFHLRTREITVLPSVLTRTGRQRYVRHRTDGSGVRG